MWVAVSGLSKDAEEGGFCKQEGAKESNGHDNRKEQSWDQCKRIRAIPTRLQGMYGWRWLLTKDSRIKRGRDQRSPWYIVLACIAARRRGRAWERQKSANDTEERFEEPNGV